MSSHSVDERIRIARLNGVGDAERIGSAAGKRSCSVAAEIAEDIICDRIEDQIRRVSTAGIADGEGISDIVSDFGEWIACLSNRDGRLEEVDGVIVTGGDVVGKSIRMVMSSYSVVERIWVARLNGVGDAERIGSAAGK